ncbi:hypothetical protein DFH28DRAFT_1116988 [Melampsora americana]|nr:hypothetical protein DFH28DRAFT_1116988 [Melampsora americana]
MSTELYYTVSNNNQTAPDSMAYSSDHNAYVHGLRRGPSQQQAGFAPGAMNMYQQQQIQAALYQQQQLEFAQQQAQLEMHLQLEQMRLQNLALQEQIMVGQVRAHQQAQAQAQAEQLRSGFHSPRNAPASGRLNFTQSQGGIFAERALARRQQAEADALYARFHPNEQEEDDLLQDLPSHAQRGHGDRGQSMTPPALVFSKPDEAFPVLAPSAAATISTASTSPKVTSKSHQHTDSDSSASTVGSLSSFTTRSLQNSECDNHEGESKPDKSTPPKKKFSEVVKSSASKATPPPSKSAISVNTTAPPKLNPFSNVFVPGSASSTNSSPKPSAIEKPASSSPIATATNSPAPATASTPVADPPAVLYRAVRSKSPPVGSSNTPRAPAARSVSNSLPGIIVGAMPIRQPRGPAAEAELTNQNFATRIRKRAIKALGARPSPSPTPTQFQFHPQLFDNLMIQPQQQFLDIGDSGIHHGMMSPGLAHLMAAARAREERFGY